MDTMMVCARENTNKIFCMHYDARYATQSHDTFIYVLN